MTGRRVVLVCGPPGAGKTTHAHKLGLAVYDRDDRKWHSETQFRRAIAALAYQPEAQAVVIRSGATLRARAKAAKLIRATEIVILATAPDVCRQRVIQRARPAPSLPTQIKAVEDWWQRYEPDDGAPSSPSPLRTSRDW